MGSHSPFFFVDEMDDSLFVTEENIAIRWIPWSLLFLGHDDSLWCRMDDKDTRVWVRDLMIAMVSRTLIFLARLFCAFVCVAFTWWCRMDDKDRGFFGFGSMIFVASWNLWLSCRVLYVSWCCVYVMMWYWSRFWKGLLLEESWFFCYLICAEDEGMMVEPFKAIGHEIFKVVSLSVWDFVQSISSNLRFLTCSQNDLLLL